MVNRVPLKVGSRPPWFGALEAYYTRFRSKNRIYGDAQAVSTKPEEARKRPIAYFFFAAGYSIGEESTVSTRTRG